MHVHRTYDVELLTRIATHPDIIGRISDPGRPPIIGMHPDIYWLVPKYDDGGQFEDGEAIGFVAFIPATSIAWNPHIAVHPLHRGIGTELMRCGIKWMFEHTPCRKIVAFPPVYHGQMIRVFEKCGLRHEGISAKSFESDGTIYDRLVMGLEKESEQ